MPQLPEPAATRSPALQATVPQRHADHNTGDQSALETAFKVRNLPRERLLRDDADHLSHAELLAVCLGTGKPGQSAMALAHMLLDQYGSLTRLLRAAPDNLLKHAGMGAAKVCRLKAGVALAERMAEEALDDLPVLTSADAVRRFLRLKLGGLQREVFACLLLDKRHRLIRYEALFQGTVDSASVHPREIIRRCLDLNAAALVLAHNHPSGNAEPSVADVALTERLAPLLREVGVQLLDHVVVGQGCEVSLATRGLVG